MDFSALLSVLFHRTFCITCGSDFFSFPYLANTHTTTLGFVAIAAHKAIGRATPHVASHIQALVHNHHWIYIPTFLLIAVSISVTAANHSAILVIPGTASSNLLNAGSLPFLQRLAIFLIAVSLRSPFLSNQSLLILSNSFLKGAY